MLIIDGKKDKKMGMFDDIIVPKSYLKGLLTKDQEKLLKGSSRYGGSVRGIQFQTKCLENALDQYKVYKQNLFINDKSLWNCEPPSIEQRTEDTPKKYPYEKGRWNKVGHNGGVNFYTSFYDEDENVWWAEFKFVFANGVIDKKELIKFEIQETVEEAEARDKKWEKIIEILPNNFNYILSKPNNKRAIDPIQLGVYFKKNQLNYIIIKEVNNAIFYCKNKLKSNKELIFIGGSFFLISDINEK